MLPGVLHISLSAPRQKPTSLTKLRFKPQVSAVFGSGSIRIHAHGVGPERAGLVRRSQDLEKGMQILPNREQLAVQLDRAILFFIPRKQSPTCMTGRSSGGKEEKKLSVKVQRLGPCAWAPSDSTKPLHVTAKVSMAFFSVLGCCSGACSRVLFLF